MAAGITDSVIIANGPAWCYFYAMRVTDRPGLDLGQRFRCTYPSDQAVVFGAEKEVKQALAALKQLPVPPGLVLLESSCALSLIGDDLQGIAAEAELSCPIITMDSGGTLGGYWAGYRKALLAALKLGGEETKPAGTRRESGMKAPSPKPLSVNFIGCSVTYYNEMNDLEELTDLLAQLGITVNLAVAAGHKMEELANIDRAALNIVIHPEMGREAAEWLAQHYGTPYIAPILPYGLKGTISWAEAVCDALIESDRIAESRHKGKEETASAAGIKLFSVRERLELGLAALRERAEIEKKRIFEHLKELQRLWGEPWFDQVLVAGPGSVLQGMERVLTEEWLDAEKITWVCQDDDTAYPDYYLPIADNEWPDQLMNGRNMLALASSEERKLLQSRRGIMPPFQAIAAPVDDEVVLSNRPFMGLRGNRAILERIWNLYMEFIERRTMEHES